LCYNRTMTAPNGFVCSSCQRDYPLNTREWLCACGGFLELSDWPAFDPDAIDGAEAGLWRYRRLLPLHVEWQPVTLGEGGTPLLPLTWAGCSFACKIEGLAPTGSFKDRGAAVLITALSGLGIQRVVEDSSGNAGASLAAYAARAGIACEICVPNTAAGPKLAQMEAHGAEVIQIKGKREYAALAAWAAAAHGAYYASHVFNPFFLAGTETLAYELWEQLGRHAPGSVILPVGNGSLLLGLYRGFERLRAAGLIDRVPRLVAVQAAACAPIYHAFHAGQLAVEPAPRDPTVASGLAIAQPARGGEILAALRDTRGTALCVSEEAILETRDALARRGFYVEETSAVAVAALQELVDFSAAAASEAAVVILTGHGLKTVPWA
jgi:threonine synthase